MFPTVHREGPRQFFVVVFTGSAGAIEPLGNILSQLPPSFPIPIVLAQHLNTERSSCLVNILRRRTELHVRWAADGDLLSPGTVFIGPPGHHVLISKDVLMTVPVRTRVGLGTPSGDLLLASAAFTFGSAALAVILSGYLRDGASGAQILRRAGGVVLVQDPLGAVVPDMPMASVSAGRVDFVLPLDVIPAALTSLVMQPGAAEFFCGNPYSAAPQPQHSGV